MKAFKKIKSRYKQFKKHPVSHRSPNTALLRYLIFNTLNRFKKNIKYKWIKPLSFSVSRGDAGMVANIYYGLYEFYESIFLLHFLRPNDVFLDIGANQGHYSLLASGIKQAHSIAIEPVPKTFQKLLKQIDLNNLDNKIEALNIGVAGKKGALYFSTDKNTMNRIVDDAYINAMEIVVDTVDAVVNNRSLTLLKLDVEGYEKFVLEGSTKTLQNPLLKAVIIELNNSGKKYKVNDIEIVDLLESYGFQPYAYLPFERKLIKLKTQNKKQFNTIFIRDVTFVQDRLSKSEPIKIWNTYI